MTTTNEKQPLALTARGGLQLASLEDAYRLAKGIAGTKFAPKGMEEERDILAAILLGVELGLPPMRSLQTIAVINGRPSIFGDAALALVRASGLVAKFTETTVEASGDDAGRRCYAQRTDGSECEHVFTIADAKRSKLWGKAGPWTDYPRRMLQMRARGFVLRDLFPDVLSGISISEEAQDMPPARVATGRVVEGIPKFLAAPTADESAPPPPDGVQGEPATGNGTPRETQEAGEQPEPAAKRGRPKGSKNKPKEEAEPAEEQEDAEPLSLSSEPTQAERDAAWLRGELEDAGVDEALVYGILADLSLPGDDAERLEQIPASTLSMIREHWDRFAKRLGEAAEKAARKGGAA